MITGAERKEKGRMVQFRAPIEYIGALELVTQLINSKISGVGSKERVTISDVMKLSIECLVRGESSIEILGKKIEISELIRNELAEYQDITMDAVEKEVKFYLMTRIQHEIDVYTERMISKVMNEEEALMLKCLEASYCTREEIEYSSHATEEEQEVLGLKKLDSFETYLERLEDSYQTLNQKLCFGDDDYESIREYVEASLFEGEYASSLQVLKLFDRYRYSYILNSLRTKTEEAIRTIQDYFRAKQNPFANI